MAWWSRGPDDGTARELAGDLEGALHVYLRDGRAEDACRVTMELADLEPSAVARVARLARVVSMGAPALVARYAEARVDLGEEDPSSLLPSEAAALARELTSQGAHASAARAFRLAAMHDEEARAWARSGDVDRTESALMRGLAEARDARALDAAESTFLLLERTGQRLAAVALARSVRHAPELLARGDALQARLVTWPRVRLVVDGRAARWVLGERIVVGRVGADLDVPSPSVSRRHLELTRDASGDVIVTDLGSSNGTQVAGARVVAPLTLRAPTVVRLGDDVTLRLEPSREGLRVEHAGRSAWLPLGPARLGGCELVQAGAHVRLVGAGGAAPCLAGVDAPEGVDLCEGDRVRCDGVEVEVARP